jgi:hypothetical protein
MSSASVHAALELVLASLELGEVNHYGLAFGQLFPNAQGGATSW